MHGLRVFFQSFDGILFVAMLLLTFFGLVTMYSYQGENIYFNKQLWWIGIAVMTFVLALLPDYRFFRVGNTTFFVYLATIIALILVLVIGEVTLGAQSRFNFGFFSQFNSIHCSFLTH